MLAELPEVVDLRAASDTRTFTTDAKGNHLYGVFEHVRSRAWSEVTGIVMHQTACLMGEKPSRYLSTGAHFVVTRGGLIIRLHELTDRIVSANGFNTRCVSIEGDGIYAGDDTTPERAKSTTWDDPTTKVREMPMALTPEWVAAYLETIRIIVRETAAAGGRIKYLFAHRQSSETRQNDPGRQPWHAVAMPAIAEHGLNVASPTFDPRTFKIDNGRMIPECWDPACKGNRY